MASWNSVPIEVIYQVLGWLAFISWAISYYPQIILNFRRKSVVGLSMDYEIINFTKHSSYLIYNATLYFSSTVQNQYFKKYGSDQMLPVAANDVAFSSHAVLMNFVVWSQIAFYERGNQKLSKISLGLVSSVWLFAAVCFFIALPSQSWLWLISIFNLIQVCLTIIKYFPQAFMNFMRKSTDGFSIGGILLDFSGGLFNYAQMIALSIDQGSWMNFSGNTGKVMISLVAIFYDSVFMCQHYVLYPDKKTRSSHKGHEKIIKPLINSVLEDQIKPQIKTSTQQAPTEDV